MRIIDRKTGHTIELIHSIDDQINTGKGWYWQDLETFKVSQSFKDSSRALNAVTRYQSLKWSN